MAAKAFRVLIASDGSPSAAAAAATARDFAWPDGTAAYGVVARERVRAPHDAALRAALEREAKINAEALAKTLLTRWPDVRVRVSNGPPIDAIVRRATLLRADVITVGWRGHGPMRRVLAGSVSRGVVRSAPCSVLVARRALSRVQNIVIGVDGSQQAQRAVALIARLRAPAAGCVTLVTAVEPLRAPSLSLLPSRMRRRLSAELSLVNRTRTDAARARLQSTADTLRAAGWQTQVRIDGDEPLNALLNAVAETGAHLLVVGARSVKGLERILLGSVAEGALNRSPVPVLIVR